MSWMMEYLHSPFLVFSPLLRGVLVFDAPPRSFSVRAPLPPLSHNISHNNITQTTFFTQHHSHNISDNNISHTTFHTPQHTHNIFYTHRRSTSRSRHSTLLLAKGVGCALWRTGAGCADFVAGPGFVNLHVQISWQPQHFVNLRGADLVAGTALCCGPMCALVLARHPCCACHGVGCAPWRWLGTGAGCADFVVGVALC